jgi:hypothetical protein
MSTTSPKPRKVTAAELAWQQKQPVVGPPSLPRLRAALKQAGFERVRLKLDANHEGLAFALRPGTLAGQPVRDRLLKLLIRTFRSAGFDIGWSELAVHSTGTSIIGATLTGPIDEVAEDGAPAIEGV